jgi:carbonic anhydrase
MVLACSEPAMDAALSRIPLGRAWIWRTPGNSLPYKVGGNRWPFGSTLFSGMSRMVVLGHSLCACCAQEGREESANGAQGGVSQILWNIRQAHGQKARAMDHVVKQIEALKSLPVISRAIEDRGVSLQGWLHLDETGLFLKYDPSRKCFEPSDFCP